MADTIKNVLIIQGDREDLIKFMESARTSDSCFDFNAFNEKSIVAQFATVELTKFLEYKFETAWKSPQDVILKISLEFPDLAFHLTWVNTDGGYFGECVEYKSIYANGEKKL